MKVAIVGVGHVGSASARDVLARGVADEIVLVNRTPERARAEALDLQHAAALMPRPARIRAGGAEEAAGADIVVLTASAPVTVPGDRRAAARANAAIVRDWAPKLAAGSPDAVLVVVTNPVDEMTWLAWRASGLPAGRVVGTGTLIDSARFRALVSERCGVHPDDLRVYILGEHGDRQFPALSVATAGGEPLGDREELRELFRRAVAEGHEVFRLKGYTDQAIAAAVGMVVECVARDLRRTLPLSTPIEGYLGVEGVCLSAPVVVGRAGVTRRLRPALDEEEAAAFRAAAEAVRASLDELERMGDGVLSAGNGAANADGDGRK